MKRTLLIVAALGLTAMTMYGQGRLNFNNSASQNAVTIKAGSSQGTGGAYLGSDYSIQLLWAPGTITDQAAFDAVATAAVITTFFGATGTAPGHGPAADGAGIFDNIAAVAIGPVGVYTVQARAWYNGGTYSTYSAASGAGVNVGMSGLSQINVTAAPTPANNTTWAPWTVNAGVIVPEPSTFALAGLGLAGLAIFRRRK